MMNWKECAGKRSWLNSRHYPDICLKGLRKLTKNSVQIGGVPVKIQTEHLRNKPQALPP
jgi:hypothetical protein